MAMSAFALFEMFTSLAGALAADPETGQLVKDVATGEVGGQKILKAGSDLAILFGHILGGQAVAAPVAPIPPA